ncbi:MAG: hypothetical protein QNJ41_10105 [Xenococcaceae cyanobacterium MO_188.B32]|nr:hypothetical protein [Xenococcaceae cyanobacterium MO_188.B32]
MKFINPPGLNNPADYGYTQAVIVPSGSKLNNVSTGDFIEITKQNNGKAIVNKTSDVASKSQN